MTLQWPSRLPASASRPHEIESSNAWVDGFASQRLGNRNVASRPAHLPGVVDLLKNLVEALGDLPAWIMLLDLR
jgi:hypothetical protein